ncbi:hypothetical protein ACQEUU_37020 [Nonomuraea sp. CA-218870]|uniref:hypothetical protein n=1 Tax=Nonomuraea sp. CA-218870 TaxID=3239998 RepID=UPI003D8E5BA6
MKTWIEPTPENVADLLASAAKSGGRYHHGNDWELTVAANSGAVRLDVTPCDLDTGKALPVRHFRAVVVEGERAPIVLERPEELDIQWDDGGDLLTLTSDGILFNPRGVDEWDLDPEGARELAAHLAAMADAYEAARNGGAA